MCPSRFLCRLDNTLYSKPHWVMHLHQCNHTITDPYAPRVFAPAQLVGFPCVHVAHSDREALVVILRRSQRRSPVDAGRLQGVLVISPHTDRSASTMSKHDVSGLQRQATACVRARRLPGRRRSPLESHRQTSAKRTEWYLTKHPNEQKTKLSSHRQP